MLDRTKPVDRVRSDSFGEDILFLFQEWSRVYLA